MRSPRNSGSTVLLDEVASTQSVAAMTLLEGGPETVIIARRQTLGVGRFERPWYSEADGSLTFSMIFRDYADHPKPWLVGMATALAVAGATHCRLAWPNDLVFQGRKAGGVLTQLCPDSAGRRVPVVGIGLNLAIEQFPAELAEKAGNLPQGPGADATELVTEILNRIELLPEPREWSDLRAIWAMFDETPRKNYLLPNGDLAVGIGVGPDGELICAVDGETQTVLAAEAIFGS